MSVFLIFKIEVADVTFFTYFESMAYHIFLILVIFITNWTIKIRSDFLFDCKAVSSSMKTYIWTIAMTYSIINRFQTQIAKTVNTKCMSACDQKIVLIFKK